MPGPEVEEFVRRLVENVRDLAIRSCDAQLRTAAPSPTATRWRAAAQAAGSDCGPPAHVLVPDAVDMALGYLLGAIDQGVLQLSYRADSGEVVDLTKDGLLELGGSYDEWVERYSKERYSEYY